MHRHIYVRIQLVAKNNLGTTILSVVVCSVGKKINFRHRDNHPQVFINNLIIYILPVLYLIEFALYFYYLSKWMYLQYRRQLSKWHRKRFNKIK
jgi:hemolysin-activating ACP:hemolysin acyltransferase